MSETRLNICYVHVISAGLLGINSDFHWLMTALWDIGILNLLVSWLVINIHAKRVTMVIFHLLMFLKIHDLVMELNMLVLRHKETTLLQIKTDQ